MSWRALAQTGADVAAMRDALLPLVAADAAAHVGEPPAVLLLLCGLNDFKQQHRGASSVAFRRALQELLADIRKLTGPSTLVVLPALPLDSTLLFPKPLKWAVVYLAALYDAQKRELAAALGSAGRVVFVDVPTIARGDAPQLLSRDGVHPNDEGYARWGEHIAAAVALRLLAADAAAR